MSFVALASGGPAIAGGVRTWEGTYRSGGFDVRVEGFSPAGRVPEGRKRPLVVILYGSGGMIGGSASSYRAAGRSLAARGYVVLLPQLFDRTGHEPGEPTEAGEFAAWFGAVGDAIDEAARMPDVDADRIGIFGYSMGAGMAYMQAMNDPRIKALVLLAGPGPAGGEKAPPPTLTLHAGRDQGSPVERARAFDAWLEERGVPHELHVYPNEGHNLPAPRFADAATRAGKFFDRHLRAPAE